MEAQKELSYQALQDLPDPSQVKRILVCQLRQIGDVLLSTPSIELLAKRFPQAEIHVFTEKKCVPMLENNPFVHGIWPLDKTKLPTVFHQIKFYRKIAANRFDMVVDFQQLPRCRAMVAFARAKIRVSFPPSWYSKILYTHCHKSEPCYAAAYKAGALKSIGIEWNGERPRLYLTEQERLDALAFLSAESLLGKRFISVDATHRHAARRWPAEYYAQLIDKLVDDDPGLHFFLPFGPGEEAEVRAIRDLCQSKDRVVVPQSISLRSMAGIMEHAILHIGNCSSPRHIAVAVNIPTFTILGATGNGWTFPSPEHKAIQAKELMDMPCQHCNKNKCQLDRICLTKLTPDLIFPLVREHLATYAK